MRARDLLALGAVVALAGCRGGFLSVAEENDRFALGDPSDSYYTQGAEVAWTLPPAATPGWVRSVADAIPLLGAAGEGTVSAGFSLGQVLFTPYDIDLEAPPRDDRPYAAWLYGTAAVQRARWDARDPAGDRADALELSLGAVGPAASGEDTQNFVHDALHLNLAKGWRHQLGPEAGVLLSLERRARLAAASTGRDTNADLVGAWGLSLGNVETGARAGATARWGVNVPRDFGVDRVGAPGLPVVPPGPRDRLSLYAFFGAGGRAVARDLFLDGNTLRDGPSVDREPAYAEATGGAALEVRGVRISWRIDTRGKQFARQRGWHSTGSIALQVGWDF